MSYAPPDCSVFLNCKKLSVTVRKQFLAVNSTRRITIILLFVTKKPDASLMRKRHASDHTVHLHENQDFSQLIAQKVVPISSGIDAAHSRIICYAVNRKHICCCSCVNIMSVRVATKVVKTRNHFFP